MFPTEAGTGILLVKVILFCSCYYYPNACKVSFLMLMQFIAYSTEVVCLLVGLHSVVPIEKGSQIFNAIVNL